MSKLPFPFLSTPPLPSPLPFAPISFPPQQHPPRPDSSSAPLPFSEPISSSTPPPFPFRYCLLPPISSPFLSTLPPLPGTYSLSVPPSSPAPALFGPSVPLPSGTVRLNRTKRRVFIRSCLAERRAIAEQRPSVSSYLVERCRKGGGARGSRGSVPKSREERREKASAREWGEGYGEGGGDKRKESCAEKGVVSERRF